MDQSASLPVAQDSKPEISGASDEAEIVKLITSCVTASNAHKAKFGYPAQNEKFQKLYRNQLYDIAPQQYYESKANYYRYYVDGMANILTRDPMIDAVVRRDEQQGDISGEVFRRIIQYVHDKNHGRKKKWDLLITAGKFGNGFMHTCFDPSLDKFLGLPAYEPIDPKYIGIAPGASSIETAEWCFYRRPVPMHNLQQAYPGVEFKRDADVSLDVPWDGRKDGDFVWTNVDPNNSGLFAWPGAGKLSPPQAIKADQIWLTDFYYRDPAKMDILTPEELKAWIDVNPGFGNDSNKEKQFNLLVQKLPMSVKVYPFGRKIQVAGGKKLEDFPNPYPWLPLLDFGMYTDADEVWSEGIISLIRDMVKNIHLASSGLAANVDYACRPFWITDDSDQDDNASLTLDPNVLKVLKHPGAFLKPAEIPQVAPERVLGLIAFRIAEIERVTGLKEILFGQRPEGVYSGVQQDKLQDAAMGAIDAIFKRWKDFNQELGARILWMVQNMMPNERQIVFVNPDEGPTAAKTFAINKMRSGLVGPENIENNVQLGDWEYYIEETSAMPFSKAQRFQQANLTADTIAQVAPEQGAILKLQALAMPGWQKYATIVEERYKQNAMGAAKAKQEEDALKKAEIQNRVVVDGKKVQIDETLAGSQVQRDQVDMALDLHQMNQPKEKKNGV